MKFSGIHAGTLMGIDETGRHVSWDGAALFYFTNGKISSLWVLGDMKALEEQLIN